MKRFHNALAVREREASIAGYSARVGQWRHIDFEEDDAEGFCSTDINGIEWEHFSATEQDARIVDTYGTPPGA